MEKITFWLVQREEGGIPWDPETFRDEKEAEKEFIDAVKWATDMEPKDFADACMIMHEAWDRRGVRIYELEV